MMKDSLSKKIFKKAIDDSTSVIGMLFIALYILSFLFPSWSVLSDFDQKKYYFLVPFIAIFLGNSLRAFKQYKKG